MKIINLLEVLVTGHFGEVQIGDMQSEVIKKLGEPDEIIDLDFGNFDIVYGRYEFFCNKDRGVFAFQNDQGQPEKFEFENDVIKVDSTFFGVSGYTYEMVQNILQKEDISYKEIDHMGCPILLLKSDIYIDFADGGYNSRGEYYEIEALKDFLLLGFRYFPDRGLCWSGS